jgi:hypothetical protein
MRENPTFAAIRRASLELDGIGGVRRRISLKNQSGAYDPTTHR